MVQASETAATLLAHGTSTLGESGARRMLSYEITERDGLRLIQPQQPLAAGSELVFEYDDCELDPSGLGPRQLASARVSIAAAAPPPKSLGKLVAELEHGEATDFDQGTACAFAIDAAWAELSVDLTDEAVPYQDVLRFELHVDGQPVQPYNDSRYPGMPRPLGGGVLGRGRDRIVAACDPAERERGRHTVQLGRHRVQMVGVLPDGTRLTSDELTLDLDCGQSAMDGCNTAAAGASRRRPSLGTLAFVALAAWWVRRRNGRARQCEKSCSDAGRQATRTRFIYDAATLLGARSPAARRVTTRNVTCSQPPPANSERLKI